MAQGVEVSGSVVSEVADRREVSEEELPLLYDSIEPDALDQLIAHTETKTGTELEVEFNYAGYTVVIQASGDITLED